MPPDPKPTPKPIPAKEAKPAKKESANPHQKALRQLEDSHQALLAAEAAYAKAKMDLRAAREMHEVAHLSEIATRPAPKTDPPIVEPTAPKKEVAIKKSDKKPDAKKPTAMGIKPTPTDPRAEQMTPSKTVGEAERRAKELKKRAAQLRKKAEQLPKVDEK